jgi:hypothetical protein
MENKNFDPLIEAAVNYWANFLTRPAYGDEANGGQLGHTETLLMTMAKQTVNMKSEVTAIQFTRFKELATEYLKSHATRGRDCTLDTDWAPEWPLSDFLRKSELANTYFPSKTMMWISFSKGTVTVGSRQIYPAETN